MKRIYGSNIEEVDLLSNNPAVETQKRCLYAGDDDIDRAAGYVCAVLHDGGWEIDYVCSGEIPPNQYCDPDYLLRFDVIILSDYGAPEGSEAFLSAVASAHHRGAPLLMLGGWGSFCGDSDVYLGTPVAGVLPVDLVPGDDRFQPWQGIVVEPAGDAQDFDELPWDRPPVIAGCNFLRPARNSQVLIKGRPLDLGGGADNLESGHAVVAELPLLIRRDHSFALAFDLAPHWVAGMVDWGRNRRKLEIARTEHISGSRKIGVFPVSREHSVELGEHYITFVQRLADLAASSKLRR